MQRARVRHPWQVIFPASVYVRSAIEPLPSLECTTDRKSVLGYRLRTGQPPQNRWVSWTEVASAPVSGLEFAGWLVQLPPSRLRCQRLPRRTQRRAVLAAFSDAVEGEPVAATVQEEQSASKHVTEEGERPGGMARMSQAPRQGR